MLNPFKDTNWNPNRAERRKFALSLIIGFPVIAVIFAGVNMLKAHSTVIPPFCLWLGLIGFAVGVVLWLGPQIARPFYVVWYFLGCCMGLVMGNVLFALFYFLVVTTFGLVMRLFGRDPLRKKFNRATPTYWRDAEKVVDLRRYYRQF
jgi:hypothetical protein